MLGFEEAYGSAVSSLGGMREERHQEERQREEHNREERQHNREERQREEQGKHFGWNSRKKRKTTTTSWTHKFVCMANSCQTRVPTTQAEKMLLEEAGLGEKSLTIPTYYVHLINFGR